MKGMGLEEGRGKRSRGGEKKKRHFREGGARRIWVGLKGGGLKARGKKTKTK